ncbi:hypothetical protein GCM10010522_24600 [Kribbella solani]
MRERRQYDELALHRDAEPAGGPAEPGSAQRMLVQQYHRALGGQPGRIEWSVAEVELDRSGWAEL